MTTGLSAWIVLAAAGILWSSDCRAANGDESVRLELRSAPWTFHTDAPANSTLTPQCPQAAFFAPCDSSFTIRFAVDLTKCGEEATLLEIPWTLKVGFRLHDPLDRSVQNYPAYKLPDGSVPVLEATLFLKLPVENKAIRQMPVGIPLAMLDNPRGKHEVVLHFSGVQ